jgi:hypothetical protein
MGAPAYEGVAEKPLRSSLSSIFAAHRATPYPSCGIRSRFPSPAESNYAGVCGLAVSAKQDHAFGVPP